MRPPRSQPPCGFPRRQRAGVLTTRTRSSGEEEEEEEGEEELLSEWFESRYDLPGGG